MSSGSSSITGVTFNTGDNYPIQYANALFFADATRRCVWTMFANASGNPDKTNRAPLVTNATGRVVDIQMGLDGNLYYVDFDGGRIFRVAYFSANQPPTAVISAQPSTGAAPLLVQFNGGDSSDPENGALTYGWDLDDDGQFDDSSIVNPTFQYDEPGQHVARLRVVDPQGSFDTASKTITVNNTPPTATIAAPTSSLHWIVGQVINFSGGATDAEDGTLSASHLSWTLIMHHCAVPLDCHTHPITTINGVASGNFTAPDHDYPSFIEIKLTATDDGPSPLSDSVSVFIDPQAVDVTLDSSPRGLDLDIGEVDGLTPFTVQVIVGSNTTVAATSPQQLGETSFTYSSWSDGKGCHSQLHRTGSASDAHGHVQRRHGLPARDSRPAATTANACNGVENVQPGNRQLRRRDGSRLQRREFVHDRQLRAGERLHGHQQHERMHRRQCVYHRRHVQRWLMCGNAGRLQRRQSLQRRRDVQFD
jgi:PKD repeat protein